MSWSTLTMYGIAALAATAGGVVITRPASDEPAVYRRRIAGTMLFALALILATFATAFTTAGGVA